MYWANFLHIYQPPVQTTEILLKVTNESYRKILAGLKEHPTAKMTLNINGCLTEMLAQNGCMDVIEDIRLLLERGQLELTASAMYHPFLPKLPDSHIIRQVELNEATNRKYFGEAYQPRGFFPPEMGFDARVGKVIQSLGYEWMILDELASSTPLDPTKTFVDDSGMKYFFRERESSFKILTAQLETAESLVREFADRIENNEYMLTAMDGETFGHHRLGLEQLLVKMYQSSEVPTICVSELLTKFPDTVLVTPRPSTWALMPKDILKKLPFSRWDDPANPVHQKQWQLTQLAFDLVEKEAEPERKLVEKAVYSDQYWWASAKPWWSIEMIERGAFELRSAIEHFKHISAVDLEEAKQLYFEILMASFEWQRSGTVEKLSREVDEEIITRMSAERPEVSQADFEQMISSLEKQMLAAADNREYLRAESFQKRMEQLKNEMNKIPVDYSGEIKVNQ